MFGCPFGLNESPYEKVGKSAALVSDVLVIPSLNESPYEKVGKLWSMAAPSLFPPSLNESPYEKVGKSDNGRVSLFLRDASMKVPTKK